MGVYLTSYRTSKGKRRVIRLYRAWRNIANRVAGHTKDGSGVARWKDLEVGFKDWADFRSWALAHGYRKGLVLDRKEEWLGYTAGNCQWITSTANALKANGVHKPGCQCSRCKKFAGNEFVCGHGKFRDECEVCNG